MESGSDDEQKDSEHVRRNGINKRWRYLLDPFQPLLDQPRILVTLHVHVCVLNVLAYTPVATPHQNGLPTHTHTKRIGQKLDLR